MEPVRTCIGCRSRAERSSLLRIVAQNSQIVADDSAVLGGRGAWMHPNIECFQLAQRKRAFGRALRVSAELKTDDLENRLNGTVISHE